MKKQASLVNIMQKFQTLYSSKQPNPEPLRKITANIQFDQNSSIPLQKPNHDLNPSITQKVINYTNQLKSYLISKLESCSQQASRESQDFDGKKRYQSSKNVYRSKEKVNKNNKSVKYLKPRSQSSTEQYLITKSSQANEFQAQQGNMVITSLSKVVDSTKIVDNIAQFKQKYSMEQMKDFEKRIRNLEFLVKTLMNKREVNPKDNQAQSNKGTVKKSIIRRKPILSLDKKKSVTLNNPQDKPRKLSNKMELRVDEPKKARNSKQNMKLLFPTRKESLQISPGYQPILDNPKSNLKKVVIRVQPFENVNLKG